MSATCCAADGITPAEHEDQRDKLILHVLCEELVPPTVEEVGRELDSLNDVIDGVVVRATSSEACPGATSATQPPRSPPHSPSARRSFSASSSATPPARSPTAPSPRC
jgi:hypothetical protein